MAIELIEVGRTELKIPESLNFKRYAQRYHGAYSRTSMSVEKTLSLIKNKGIEASSSEILIISDNRLSYSKDSIKKVFSFYQKNPAHDIILFYAAKFKNKINKSYYGRARDIILNDIQFLHDFEISFKLKSINDVQVSFCEDFGPGGIFPFYENKVFVAEAIAKGLRVMAVPGSLELYTEDFYWEKELSSVKQKSLGAALCRIYGEQYIHQYVDFSMNKLIQGEKVNNRINDWSIAKIELLLKGAYEYLNFTTDGKHVKD